MSTKSCVSFLLQQLVCVVLAANALAFVSYGSLGVSMRLSPQPAGGMRGRNAGFCTRMCSDQAVAQNQIRRDVLVVGGGPIGLATAFALNRLQSIDAVTVVEQNDMKVPTPLEIPYSIDAETQDIAKALGLEGHIQASGAPPLGNTIVVDGQTLKETGVAKDISPAVLKKLRQASLRSSRTDLVAAFRRACIDVGNPLSSSKVALCAGSRADVVLTSVFAAAMLQEGISVLDQTSLVSISPHDGARTDEQTAVMTATVQRTDMDGTTRDEELKTWLVVGADGKHSKVREEMCKLSQRPPLAKTLKPGATFELLSIPYENAGAVAKTMRVPFAEVEKLEPPFGNLMLRSASQRKAAPSWTRATLFRMRSTRDSILLLSAEHDHPLFTNGFKGVGELREWLEAEYGWLTSHVTLTDQQLQTLLASNWCSAAALPLPPSLAPSGGGLLLAGDALHCVPPDLGKGVNAGMRDVKALVEALGEEEAGGQGLDEAGLRRALLAYQDKVVPEAEAICKLTAACSFGGAWAHSRPGRLAQIMAAAFNFNRMARQSLAKIPLLGGTLFYPSARMLAHTSASFSQAWQRAERTTVALSCFAGVLASLVITLVATLLRAVGLLVVPV